MERYDVVVLGTGAAGLTAAIAAHEGGASVAVFEKADKVGGTTAWSGGQVWIPNNPHMGEVAVNDSRERSSPCNSGVPCMQGDRYQLQTRGPEGKLLAPRQPSHRSRQSRRRCRPRQLVCSEFS